MITGVCTAIFGKPNNSRVWVLICLGIAQFLVYSLFAVFAIVPFISLIISSKGKLLIDVYEAVRKNIMGYFALSVYMSVLTAIALNGILSGYGGGQFLAPGGIAPLPVGTTLFIYGVSVALAIKSKQPYCEDSVIQTTTFGPTILAIAGVSYSFLRTNEPGKFWAASYYPTKLAISVLIVVTILLIVQIVQKIEAGESRLQHSLNAVLVVAAISSLVFSSYNSWPFSGGFMGNTRGVVRSLNSGTSEVVDGESVLQGYESVKNSKMSVIYLSDNHESELNTRWIN